jgi:hypothetical protein
MMSRQWKTIAKDFTPGPWSVPGTPIPMVYGPKGERVCRIIDHDKDAMLIHGAMNTISAILTSLRPPKKHCGKPEVFDALVRLQMPNLWKGH